MTGIGTVDAARRFFERLNEVPEAQRYLQIFDRAMDFSFGGEVAFHVAVQGGRLRVGAGPAAGPGERMLFRTDPDTLTRLMNGTTTFVDEGAGVTGKFQCISGPGYYPDVSWTGILVRLAQESRI